MKKSYLLLTFLVMLFASPLLAFDEPLMPEDDSMGILLAQGPREDGLPPAQNDESRLERFHKFRLMKLSEIAEQAGIDDKTVLKMSEIFKKYDKQRFDLFNEGRRLRIELKRLLDDKNAKKDDINKVIDAYIENRTKIHNLRTEEIKEIRKLLTPEQQARVILYMMDRMEKGMKHMQKFGPKNGMGPGMGPGGMGAGPMGGWFGDEE